MIDHHGETPTESDVRPTFNDPSTGTDRTSTVTLCHTTVRRNSTHYSTLYSTSMLSMQLYELISWAVAVQVRSTTSYDVCNVQFLANKMR
jgi:hypothetical protein